MTCQGLSRDARPFFSLLVPHQPPGGHLTSAAQWYVDGFAKRNGIKVRVDFPTERERLPITIDLFRVLQESLKNVPSRLWSFGGQHPFQQQAEIVMLEIQDCGRGIPADLLNRFGKASSKTGVGLAGMRERLNELNGKLEWNRMVLEPPCGPQFLLYVA